jgi:type IV secretory pathway TrbL component
VPATVVRGETEVGQLRAERQQQMEQAQQMQMAQMAAQSAGEAAPALRAVDGAGEDTKAALGELVGE